MSEGAKTAGAKDDFEAELDAIRSVIAALTSLNPEARGRVISYAFKRLGISSPTTTDASTVRDAVRVQGEQISRTYPQVIDIRTLKEEKQPSSAREMAVLVAYYLSEAAPPTERKSEVSAEDIRQYFKQAGFKLPNHPDMTLVHTKNAGYLDNGSARGLYRLNPVGYNLVVHSLPPGSKPGRRPARDTSRRRKPRLKH